MVPWPAEWFIKWEQVHFCIWHWQILTSYQNSLLLERVRNLQQISCILFHHTVSKVCCCTTLGNVRNSFLLHYKRCHLKVHHACQKIKHFMSYGWVDIDTLRIVVHSFRYLSLTCLTMPIPLVNCTDNSALVSATVPCHMRTSVQFIDVIQLWLINSLLDGTSYIAVDQILRFGQMKRQLASRKVIHA